MSSQSQSDIEENENAGSNSMCPIAEIQINQVQTIKSKLDTKEEEQTIEDIFGNDIILPRVKPVSAKERRESKEKSKKELEEEEREKMQCVFDIKIYSQCHEYI